LGYFADAAGTKKGIFTASSDSGLITSWDVYPTGNQAFTHSSVDIWGDSKNNVSIAWSYNIWAVAPSINLKTVTATLNVDGRVYYVYSATATVPTPEQVILGVAASGAALAAGSVPATANVEATFTVDTTGIVAGTTYYVYVVGTQTVTPNLQLQLYVLGGTRGDIANQQFYRFVTGTIGNLILTPVLASGVTNTATVSLTLSTDSGSALQTGPVALLTMALLGLLLTRL